MGNRLCVWNNWSCWRETGGKDTNTFALLTVDSALVVPSNKVGETLYLKDSSSALQTAETDQLQWEWYLSQSLSDLVHLNLRRPGHASRIV